MIIILENGVLNVYLPLSFYKDEKNDFAKSIHKYTATIFIWLSTLIENIRLFVFKKLDKTNLETLILTINAPHLCVRIAVENMQ